MKYSPFLLGAAALCCGAQFAAATPYASGLANNAGTVSFFLNENADDVKVVLNNGAGGTNDLGALARGKYAFALGTNTTFRVDVSKSSGAGYKSDDGSGNAVKLPISAATNYYLNFENPRGLKVNRNPASPFFGRIYTSNSRTNATSSNVVRPMQAGVYMINPDQTSAHLPGMEDTALTGNLPAVSGGPLGTSFPYEFVIGQDDNVYLCDWTDSTGNLWVVGPMVTNFDGAPVLKPLSALNTAKTPVGVDNTHGSVNGAYVSGMLGDGSLTVYTLDEDLQTDKTAAAMTEVSSVWKYSIGGAPLPYANDPTKVFTPAGKQGIATADQTGDLAGSTNGLLYYIDQRSAGSESGLDVLTTNGVVLWDSYDASVALRGGVNDILTNSIKVAVSYDSSYIAVARSTGLVWIMPLTNGIPDLSKRLKMQPFSSTASLRSLAFDAAGNLYVNNSSSELLSIFSPGGTTVTSTSGSATGTTGSFSAAVPATTVSVIPTVAAITENGGSNGVFTITRAGDNSSPLTINYTLSGTADNGTDYVTTAVSVVLPAFQASTNIFITPINDAIPELTESALLTLQGGTGYSVGSPGAATVSILDDETPQVSFEPSATQMLLESYATSTASFTATRRGLLTAPLTVHLAYSGSAIYGGNYTGPSTVTIPANSASATVTLTPINDQVYEGNRTAVVSIAAGSGYTVGPANSVSATIVDDEVPPGQILFSDNFDTNSSTLWQVNYADPSDGSVDFAFDYSAFGIPPAPGGGGSKGLRFQCGNTTLEIDAVTASPIGLNLTGDYRLKYDMWINYNGPMADGGAGSTQNFDAGVGTAGTTAVWLNNPDSDGVWFSATGDGADGNTGGDYDGFIGYGVVNDDIGAYAAGVGPANGGHRNSTDPFYAIWGGQAAPAAQLALYPQQTGTADIGNAGMAWHSCVITKLADVVTWAMDGITIATVTNDVLPFNGNIFLGYQDIFSSGSISDNPPLSFGLVDNVVVETYVNAPAFITSIANAGGTITIQFTGPASATAASFKLQSATNVAGPYADENTAAISMTAPGTFQATITAAGSPHFYRIKE